MTQLVDQFEQALLSLDRVGAKEILTQSNNTSVPFHVIEEVIVPALERIGMGWEQGKVALSQVYMSGRICEELVDSILPLEGLERKQQPKMAIAVLEDYHLLGKRIVYSVLRAGGFDLLDYGQMNVDKIVNRARNDSIEVLLISALMLPSALRVKDVRAKLNQMGIEVKIVVGGAPFRFDDFLWKEVDADAMGKNASEAVAIVSQIMERKIEHG